MRNSGTVARAGWGSPAASGTGLWAKAVWAGITLILAGLTLTPIVWLVLQSLRTDSGAWTLANYIEVFSEDRYVEAARNSLVLALAAGVLSVAMAAPLAWLVSRTDLPGKRWIRALIFGSLVTPPFLGATAWALLAGPNAGYLNRLYRFLTGSEGHLFNIYSMEGVIFVVSLSTFPFVFVTIANALDMIPADLEDAANILGARSWTTMLHITLPLVLPAIVGGFILAFLEALALFGTPAMLGMPAGIHFMTTRLWEFFHWPRRPDLAAAYSLPLLAVTGLLLWLQRRLLGRRGYEVVTGKPGQRRLVPLGRARYPLLGAAVLVLGISVVLPYSILLLASLLRAWGQGPVPGNFTLENFRFVFSFESTKMAIRNSLQLGIGAATIGCLLAALISYLVERRLVRFYSLMRYLATVPFVIPGIVLAVGIFAAYARPPLMLYGTIWILLVAYLTKYLPLGFTTVSSAMRSIHTELEEAARILGASSLRALWDVTFPLVKQGILAAWILILVSTLRELSASILLFTARSRVISVTIYDLYEEGHLEAISVMAILLLGAIYVIVLLGQRITGRDVTGTGA